MANGKEVKAEVLTQVDKLGSASSTTSEEEGEGEEEEEERYYEGTMPEVCVLVLTPRFWPVASVCQMLNPATCLPSYLRGTINHYTNFYSKSKQASGKGAWAWGQGRLLGKGPELG